MTLVDTSVWIDHFRRADAALASLLETQSVLVHPFVVGELACGNLADRQAVLQLMRDLPSCIVADDEEVLQAIERHRLHGKGLGYVDAHLLASVLLTGGSTLWTRDKALRSAAAAIGRDGAP